MNHPLNFDASKSSSKETDNTINEEVFKLPSKGGSRTILSSVAQVCDRAGVSDRTVALLASSLLFDMGQNKNDQNSVIDRHKIRRERAKVRKDLQNSVEAELDCPFAIYFDGRIDKTLKKISKGYKSSKKLSQRRAHLYAARAWIILCWPCITQDRIIKTHF